MSGVDALMSTVTSATGRLFLIPLAAEFLLGNIPIAMLAALVTLAPLYGGGALLIRDLTRRAGRGVPTMLPRTPTCSTAASSRRSASPGHGRRSC
jgi:hypothetical protein